MYKKLDALIIGRLDLAVGKPLKLSSFNVILFGPECQRIATGTGRQPYRIIDGRLQALKRMSEIEFVRDKSRSGWIRRTKLKGE